MTGGPTNADLMAAIIRISNDRAEDRVLLSTLRDSYRSRVVKADKFEADMRSQVGETKLKVGQLQREVAVMRPVVKRMRMRTILRRAFVECFGRWWGLLTTAAFTVGGLIVWFGDHWPKIVAFLRKAAGVILPIAIVLALAAFAQAHDTWISRGGLRNGAGEWCCGTGDCAVIDKDSVAYTARGYEVHGSGTIGEGAGSLRERYDEIVPVGEAQPSPDGAYWRCKRPDGSRRCFFAPPPNT